MEFLRYQAELYAALADVSRLRLLYAMADEPQNVGELVKRVGLSQPSVSRHLRIMRESGLVSATRKGKLIYYEPTDARVLQALDIVRAMLTEQIAQQRCEAAEAKPRPHIEPPEVLPLTLNRSSIRKDAFS